MATRGSARLLGRSDDIGTLEVGKCADLFMIDTAVWSWWVPASIPTSVLGGRRARAGGLHRVHGCVTVEHGHLVTVDEEKLARRKKCRAYLNR